MNRELLEALRLVQGRGKMSAKDKYGWHPPLSDDGDAMPNSPRDIRSLEDEPDSPLKGTTGADFGQDQFGTPSPNQEKMAKAVGALRLPPVVAPEQATMKDLMSLKMPSEDFDPGASEFAKQNAHDKGAAMLVSVDPSSYFGGKKPKPMGSGYPMTMAKSDRAAFRGPTSDTAFEIGGEDDPSEGREPWANVPAASFKSLAGVPMGDDEPDLGAAQPELSRGPGPQPGANLDPSLTEGAPEDLSALEGFPEEIPTEDLTDEIDIDTGAQPQSSDSSNPEQSELQRYIAEMNNGEGQASDRRDSDFLNAQQKMNSDMGLYKLLFASANKIGSHAGQQSSDEPFNSFADGAIKSNDKRSELLVKDRAQNKQRQDDKLKALMFMDKQRQDKEKYQDDLTFRGKQLDQLATDKEEGRKVQRDTNTMMAQLRDDQIRATLGLGQGKLDLEAGKMRLENDIKNKDIDFRIANAGSTQGLKGAELAEQIRANKAREKIASEKAKQDAKEKAHKAKGISQGAAKTEMFRKRMDSAAAQFDKLVATGFDPMETKDTVLEKVPFFGNSLVSKNHQLARQYQVEFVRAKLRDESGATIGEKEAYEDAAEYFPRWGDSKELLARKKVHRLETIKNMKDSYDAQRGEAQSLSPEASSSGLPPPPPGKVRVKDPDTGKPLLIDEADLQEALNDGAEQM